MILRAEKKKRKKGLADCRILLSVKVGVDLSEVLGVSIAPLVWGCERAAKCRCVLPYRKLSLYSLQKGMRLSGCLRLWVGHVALWKCQNLSLDDKRSRAQHWTVLWNIWLWVSWTWNSYCTVPFLAPAHSLYWLSGSRFLTSKQDFTNPAEGSIHLLLASMDGSSLTAALNTERTTEDAAGPK